MNTDEAVIEDVEIDGKNTPEWVFIVAKQADGRIAIGNLDGTKAKREPVIDDIYAAACIIQRDVEVQQGVAGVAQALGGRVGQPQKTQGGVIVPEPTSKFKKVTRP